MSQQAREALEIANRTRLARSELRRRLRDGTLTVPDVLAGPPPEAATMMLRDLLRAPRGWGDARVRELCRTAEVSELQTLGRLTPGSRARVLAALEPPPPPVKRAKPAKPARIPRSVPAAPLAAWINRRFPDWTNQEICEHVHGTVNKDAIRRIRRHPETEVAFQTVDRLLTAFDRPDLLDALYGPA